MSDAASGSHPQSLRSHGYIRIVDRFSDFTGLTAMYLLFLMIAVLISDAVADNGANLPIHWCVELTQFTLAAYYLWAGPHIENNDRVRMDWFYANLSERWKTRLDVITIGCLIFYLGVLPFG